MAFWKIRVILLAPIVVASLAWYMLSTRSRGETAFILEPHETPTAREVLCSAQYHVFLLNPEAPRTPTLFELFGLDPMVGPFHPASLSTHPTGPQYDAVHTAITDAYHAAVGPYYASGDKADDPAIRVINIAARCLLDDVLRTHYVENMIPLLQQADEMQGKIRGQKKKTTRLDTFRGYCGSVWRTLGT